MFLNGLGAFATAITTAVVLVTKFIEGAWITVVLIPALILMMRGIHHHYGRVVSETEADGPVNTTDLCEPIRPDSHRSLERSLRKSAALRLVHFKADPRHPRRLRGRVPKVFAISWDHLIANPAREAGLPIPELVVLQSPFRFVIKPIVDYALDVEKAHPDGHIAVVIPELVEARWYYLFLHNHRSSLLKALLLLNGSQRISVINVPWYLNN